MSEGPRGCSGNTAAAGVAPSRSSNEGGDIGQSGDGGQGRTGRGARRCASGPPGSRGADGPTRRRRVGERHVATPPEEEPTTPLSDLDVMTAIWMGELRDGTGSTLVRPETRRVRALYENGWTDDRILNAVRAALHAGWTLHDVDGTELSLRALICPPAEDGILYRVMGPPGGHDGAAAAPWGPQIPLPRTAVA